MIRITVAADEEPVKIKASGKYKEEPFDTVIELAPQETHEFAFEPGTRLIFGRADTDFA